MAEINIFTNFDLKRNFNHLGCRFFLKLKELIKYFKMRLIPALYLYPFRNGSLIKGGQERVEEDGSG